MNRRSYTVEFKKQAMDLAISLGSVTQAAQQLGISDTLIHSWRKRLNTPQIKGESSSSASLPICEQEELKRLRKENAELKKVNHILKAAAAFFSQDHLK